MDRTLDRQHPAFTLQRFMGLALMVSVVATAPGVAFGGQADPEPTRNVSEEANLPVDISIDIATGEEDALPKPDITIHLLNERSGREVEPALPRTNASADHPSSAAARASFDTPPVAAPAFDAPPVLPGSVVEAPLFDAPPAVTPSLDVPVADLPPAVDTLPTLPPTAGRP